MGRFRHIKNSGEPNNLESLLHVGTWLAVTIQRLLKSD